MLLLVLALLLPLGMHSRRCASAVQPPRLPVARGQPLVAPSPPPPKPPARTLAPLTAPPPGGGLGEHPRCLRIAGERASWPAADAAIAHALPPRLTTPSDVVLVTLMILS